ncbi:protein of unknown function [Singulisphaera sp. GP187]|uniref:GIY-YIG nuclease family protein n=1 Tax=Singulisphaera sp. GP187 TaxID=1882752 RepID=UPI0009264A4C|nr:GIY-YIG nuclease family protein [Singulisphaera sp. GP187]SIO13135.1 protein of unknown function [Singulisphaera sp. GP187]
MFYVVAGLVVLVSIGLAVYALISKSELVTRVAALEAEIQEQDASDSAEVVALRSELAKLEKLRHVPNILERSKKLEAEIAARANEAQQQAFEIVQTATREANTLKQRITTEIEKSAAAAKETFRTSELQAQGLIEAATKEAKQIASQARKEAKEKTQKVDDTLNRATTYALEIREKAETRAHEIGSKAYEALKRQEFYEATATAMQNVVSGYANTYMVPASHVIDELAEEFGFHKAGERLKIARDRTRIMEKGGVAATCNYPEGWKREYAISFVLGAFNGKVDSILARLKPANQGKLIQEIRDVYALANHNGEVFKNARIHEEFLDARLEELKWTVAVQRVKEKQREEQRAIREQIREDERARKEIERAIKQSEREEETITKAIERARLEYEMANAEDRVKYEAQLQDLAEKLRTAEEKNQRAISMAQQTKRGNVYVISNIGSFGDDVYKIGLTRRLEPLDRVKELGDASVPFAFDVHAMIRSEDAPALEAALHRRFLQNQVNKVNRRKEFFRLKLQDIRAVIEELAPEVKWTMAAEARDYRDSLALERQMQVDPEFRKRWTESESAYQSRLPFDDEGDESEQEDENAVLAEEVI